MAQHHVPTSLDQITAEVMTDALRSSGFDEVVVSSVSAERIAIGEGFLGELARLTLDYSAGTGPATAIAKIPTTDSGLKPIGDLLDVYGREHRAYANLLSQMKVRTPQAYLNVGDDESLAYCLVLEDVGGYASGDHHAGATLEQARAAVVAAAGVHGRWWNQVDQFDWVPPIDSPLNMGLQGMFESSWPMVVDQHGEQLGAEVVARLEFYLPTVSDMFASFGESSRTLTHNDFRLDNMFFDVDELVLIDWQLLGVGRNGHIGFNEPGSPFDSRTRRIELAQSTREANARFFESIDEVPRYAVTMGVGTILEAQRLRVLAFGDTKAQILERVLHGEDDNSIPLNALRNHPDAALYIDAAAAACLG